MATGVLYGEIVRLLDERVCIAQVIFHACEYVLINIIFHVLRCIGHVDNGKRLCLLELLLRPIHPSSLERIARIRSKSSDFKLQGNRTDIGLEKDCSGVRVRPIGNVFHLHDRPSEGEFESWGFSGSVQNGLSDAESIAAKGVDSLLRVFGHQSASHAFARWVVLVNDALGSLVRGA
jgi:hypothetical protein